MKRAISALAAVLITAGCTDPMSPDNQPLEIEPALGVAVGPTLNAANGHYYEAMSTPNGLSWDAAKSAAESLTFLGCQGHLATITSMSEQTFTVGAFPQSVPIGRLGYWIGGIQPPGSPEPDGGWSWVTGEPFVFTFWASGEPNNIGGEEAIHLNGKGSGAGEWNDIPRGTNQHRIPGYVVEYPTPCVLEEPARVLVIDEESIGKDVDPNGFSEDDVNEPIADIGLRAVLPYFAANVGQTITLHTGEVGDEGWFALKTIPGSWDAAGPTFDGLRNYIEAGPGLGSGGSPEDLLDKIPDVTPLRATGLAQLQGLPVCAVVYKSDVSINYDPLDGSLKGDNLGIVAFVVKTVTKLTGYSSSSLPEVEIEILDAEATCGGELTLHSEAPAPISSSDPFDIG